MKTNTMSSQARKCHRKIRRQLGPNSPRYHAFLNLLHSYLTSPDALGIALRMKELLDGYGDVQREFGLLLPEELMEEIFVEEDHNASQEVDVEIEEEHDTNIYGDYDVVEMTDDESDDVSRCEIEQTEQRIVQMQHGHVAREKKRAGKVIRTPKRGRPRKVVKEVDFETDLKSNETEEAMTHSQKAVEGAIRRDTRHQEDSVESTSKRQCIEHCHLNTDRGKKRRWSADEDKKLVSLYQREGSTWKTVSDSLPGRSQKQCRERYRMHLASEKEKGWTCKSKLFVFMPYYSCILLVFSN
jgi:hypothetical protein